MTPDVASLNTAPDAEPSVGAGGVPVGGEPIPVGGGFEPLSARPQRVLFFGKSRSRTRATAGFVGGLRQCGLEVRWVNFGRLKRRLGTGLALRATRRIVRRFRPDLLFAVYPDLPLELQREFRDVAPFVQWIDQPVRGDTEEQVESLATSTALFMTAPSRFAGLRRLGVQRLVPVLECFDPADHHPFTGQVRNAARGDLLFIGSPGRKGWRARELATLAVRRPIRVHGLRWESLARKALPDLDQAGLDVRGPIKPPAYRRACAESRIVLGLNEFNDEPGYFSNRTQLTLACGAFHLTHYVPGLEAVFRNREHLVWFHDFDECAALIEEFLERSDERQRIADRGREEVGKRHRFVDRMEQVLRVLETGLHEPSPFATHAQDVDGRAAATNRDGED